MIKRYLSRLPHALRGISFALKHDFGFRTQIYTTALVATVILYFFTPLTTTEFLFLGVAAMFILITELQNSAIEAALDQLHPERHERIMRSKDMAAGAVLLAALFALVVVVVLSIERFYL